MHYIKGMNRHENMISNSEKESGSGKLGMTGTVEIVINTTCKFGNSLHH